MGELQGSLFSLDFNRSIRVEARPERLTGDAGALMLRALSDRLGLPALVERHLSDARNPDRIRHPFLELIRTRVLTMSQGRGDQNDVGWLHDDPALRLAVSERRGESPLRESGGRAPDGLCSQPTLSRLQGALASAENRRGLGRILRQIGRPFFSPRAEITVDLDSLPHEVHGHQAGSAYNRHYGIRCYHPLVASVLGRFFLGARLRPGNAHTADGGLDFVLPLIRWLRTSIPEVWLRTDAGFPGPALLDALEAEGVPYISRIRGNRRLDRLAEAHLGRPPGRPPAEGRTWFHELSYQARSWTRARRVILVVVERADEQQHLFLDHFFLLTNVSIEHESAPALLARYRQRGSAEADFGDCNTALPPKLSSAQRTKSHYRGNVIHEPYPVHDGFAANEAELLLRLIAANLMACGAQLLHVHGQARLSRERFRAFLLRTPGRVLLGGRRVTLIIPSERADLWLRFHARLTALNPARGSPSFQAPPSHS